MKHTRVNFRPLLNTPDFAFCSRRSSAPCTHQDKQRQQRRTAEPVPPSAKSTVFTHTQARANTLRSVRVKFPTVISSQTDVVNIRTEVQGEAGEVGGCVHVPPPNLRNAGGFLRGRPLFLMPCRKLAGTPSRLCNVVCVMSQTPDKFVTSQKRNFHASVVQ